MSVVERVMLRAATWVRLPGTPHEVYLHGKMHGEADGIELLRTGDSSVLGGWDVAPVLDRCYIRRAP